MLSVICLFISLSEALPDKIAIIGLDLSANPTITGWFLVAATSYFFILTFTFGVFHILKYRLPHTVNRLTKNLTGNTLDLTKNEIYQDEYQNQINQPDPGAGTTEQELKDIENQESVIASNKSRSLQTAYDYLIIFFYFLLPITLYAVSQYYLITFLLNTCSGSI